MSQEITKQNLTSQFQEASSVIFRLLEQKLGSPVFNLWLVNTHFIELNDHKAILGVQNRFIKNWIERKYTKDILSSIDEICNIQPDLNIKIDANLFSKSKDINSSQKNIQDTDESLNKNNVCYHSQNNKITQANVKQKYRLESFIGIQDNALPLLVARQFVDEIKNSLYHKLSFFGAKGNGKTHLLKGIEIALCTNGCNLSTKYSTAEAFTNSYVHAIQSKQYNEFQKTYNNLDVLILDDIQFLAGKTKTQEGLLSTIKHLESEGKHIVLASDRHPNNIPGLCPNLREFISAGMMIEVPPPCHTSRMAILKSLCCKASAQCPNNVLEFLAKHFTSSVRELEGALLKVMAYSSLCKQPASVELSRKILQPHLMHSQKNKDNVESIINDVAAIFTADPKDLISRKQDRSTVRARQIAMYTVRKLSQKSYQEIGNIFGGKKYSAVMYAEKIAQKIIDNDPNVARHVDAIIKRYK